MFLFLLFEKGSHCVALAHLVLTTWSRLILGSIVTSYLSIYILVLEDYTWFNIVHVKSSVFRKTGNPIAVLRKVFCICTFMHECCKPCCSASEMI